MKDLCKLLRKPIVLEAMGWGNSKLYENIHNDLFIEPVKIGERSSAWPSDEVTALQDAYIAGSSKEEIRSLVVRLIAARKSKSLGEGP